MCIFELKESNNIFNNIHVIMEFCKLRASLGIL